jgi:hypothetical protein
MGKFADLRRAYLEEKQLSLFEELDEAGALDAHCRAAERRALDQVAALQRMGWNIDQAEEWAREDLLGR